ncbi:MAG: hypothetical protein AB1894_00005 [Chloroflexota bacterium]
MRVHELAKLVRLRALKHIGLDKLKGLFETCVTPDEVAKWIKDLSEEQIPTKHKKLHKYILEVIWELQKEAPGQPVEYAAIQVVLRRDKKIDLTKDVLIDLCKTLSLIAYGIDALDETVELTQRPDKIAESAIDTLKEFPEEDQPLSNIRL